MNVIMTSLDSVKAERRGIKPSREEDSLSKMLNFVLCPLLCGLVAQAQLAGNEDYALDARKALKKSLKRRDTPAITFEPTSTSFTLGNKTYISPTSSQFKQYALDTDWGLDSYRGQILPITVFDVQGEVTCDILGKQVEDYATDDVWDQVSAGKDSSL